MPKKSIKKKKYKIDENTNKIIQYEDGDLNTLEDVEEAIINEENESIVNDLIVKADEYESDKVTQIIEDDWWHCEERRQNIDNDIADVNVKITNATAIKSSFSSDVLLSDWYNNEKQIDDLTTNNRKLKIRNQELQNILHNNLGVVDQSVQDEINVNQATINSNNVTLTGLPESSVFELQLQTLESTLTTLESQRTFSGETETTDSAVLTQISVTETAITLKKYGKHYKATKHKLRVLNKDIVDLNERNRKSNVSIDIIQTHLTKIITGSYTEMVDGVEVTKQLLEGEYNPWLGDYSNLSKYDPNGNLITRPPKSSQPFISSIAKLKSDYFDMMTNRTVFEGFTSAATGEDHTYNAEIENQLNLVGAVMAGVDMLYTCTNNMSKVKTQIPHTADQIKQVFADGIMFKATTITIFNMKRDVLNNATTIEEITNTNWN